MAAAKRRVREREEMRRRILTAASNLIEEEGYDKLTIRKVADRIEYSPMALYNHFADKDAILQALAEEAFGRFLASFPRRSTGSPLNVLRRYMLNYVQFAIDQPEQYRIIFMTPRGGKRSDQANDKQTTEHVPEGGSRIAFAKLVEGVAACGGEYEAFRDTFQVALFLWTCMHGTASLLITLTQFPFGNARAYAESTIGRLLSGLVASSSSAVTLPTDGRLSRRTPAKRHRKLSVREAST